MSKRRTEAARVLTFFKSVNLEVASTLLELAKEAVKERQPPSAKVRQRLRKKADGAGDGPPAIEAAMERARQRKARREAQPENVSLSLKELD